MTAQDSRNRMWSEALDLMARAEKLHQQLFKPSFAPGRVIWEPPVDILETENEMLVLAALPGVDLDQIQAEIEGQVLVIAGERLLPAEVKTAVIHRLELPQGRFQRRIALPSQASHSVSHEFVNGCLIIRLSKAR